MCSAASEGAPAASRRCASWAGCAVPTSFAERCSAARFRAALPHSPPRFAALSRPRPKSTMLLHSSYSRPTTKHVALVTTSRVSDANPHAHNDLRILKHSIELNQPAFAMTADTDRADYILVVGSGTRFYYDL